MSMARSLSACLPLCLLAACSTARTEQTSADTTITVSDNVTVPKVMGFGVNLGQWTSWGAEQLMSNVIMNPGFEGLIDRALVIVKHASPGRFDDDADWLARPDGFWDQARFDVRTGPHAGESGRIVNSRRKDAFGLPAFETASKIALDATDVVSLTRISDSDKPAEWWYAEQPGARYAPEPHDHRPGSKGVQALRISSADVKAEAASYVDAIGGRAGKMLPLEGTWRLSFWSRLDRGSVRFRVQLGREGSKPVFAKDIPATREWQRSEFEFSATDTGPPNIVSLRFEADGAPSGDILLDDVDLRRASDAGHEFRAETISALKTLRPAWLRDWQGQLGDDFANRTVPATARRASRYRPGGMDQANFSYGLPEFLDLALEVSAEPWIVIPSTFSDDECARTGAFLAQDRRYAAFPEIVAEYGNENWNNLFRPAGIPYPVAHGEAADRCFTALRRAAPGLPIRTAINAQHANPAAALQFASSSGQADIVALAPYFSHRLDAGIEPAQAAAALFAGDHGNLREIAAGVSKLHKETAVYEVGLHTDAGSAPDDERMKITSGTAAASALARTMLDALSLGVRRQCVYALAGFDNRTQNPQGFVRLWGIARDLASDPPRLRPSGLALALVNHAIQGDMVRTESSGPEVAAYAFHSGTKWSAVLSSASPYPRAVTIRFPSGAALPAHAYGLVASATFGTNEDAKDVKIQPVSVASSPTGGAPERVTATLPPFGLLVLVNDVLLPIEGQTTEGQK